MEWYAHAITLSTGVGLLIPEPHPRRNFGSSASLKESPNRLKPNTPRLIAIPGNSAIHGAFSAYDGAEPESINPHDGVGSAVPRPRYDSAASVRIALPSCAVSMMMYGAITLGRMCCRITRRHEAPSELAASTYWFSFTDSAVARTTRAARGMMGMAIATTTFCTA